MSGASAVAQGESWGRRAEDWSAVQEATAIPLYEAALARLGLARGDRLLDVGCGAGLFAEMASRRGASVDGIDASERFAEIARRRVPAGRFFVGDMENLPFGEASFDVVTGFNVFPYAAQPKRALAAAARATRRGGSVLAATWGDADDCEALGYVRAVAAFLPASPPRAPGPVALSGPRALRDAALEAGLAPREQSEIDVPFLYPDLATALRGILSAGPAVLAIEAAGEDRVRSAVVDALAPFRLSTGGYRLENRFRFLIATA